MDAAGVVLGIEGQSGLPGAACCTIYQLPPGGDYGLIVDAPAGKTRWLRAIDGAGAMAAMGHRRYIDGVRVGCKRAPSIMKSLIDTGESSVGVIELSRNGLC
jgi:hypothetical protein